MESNWTVIQCDCYTIASDFCEATTERVAIKISKAWENNWNKKNTVYLFKIQLKRNQTETLRIANNQK